MARKKKEIPKYGTVVLKGVEYYRTRIEDADGRRVALYARTPEELDFQVTPHQLRHTYITNLIYSGADPKTVQYLAGHKHSKITMDIYAKVKYNKPKELSSVVNKAFAPKKGATPNKTRNG